MSDNQLTTEALLDIKPQTFREAILHGLVSRGMFADQAYAVVARFATSDAAETMAGRWDDTMKGYPPIMLPVLRGSVDAEALRYIDECCPEAWFRPLFVSVPPEKPEP